MVGGPEQEGIDVEYVQAMYDCSRLLMATRTPPYADRPEREYANAAGPVWIKAHGKD